jgi:endonuclease G
MMLKVSLIALLIATSPALAYDFSFLDCQTFFANGFAPIIANKKLEESARPVCYSEFALLHSGISRGPIWSAEHLTAENLLAGQNVARPSGNAFHEDPNIPEDERAMLDDYKRSGFDRGHMSPNGDMSSTEAKAETFTLANMVPQAPCHNEVLWEGIESAVRTLVLEEDEAHIVTGPAFIGSDIDSLKGRVLVPTHIFKAVYVPSLNGAAAYWTPNSNSLKMEVISIAKLKDLTGIDVFPGIADAIKQTAMKLPPPEPAKHACRVHPN